MTLSHEQGLAEHRARRLAAAERIFHDVLARTPDDAETWHLLAIVLQQTGRNPEALTCIRRALEIAPAAERFNTLGLSLDTAGDYSAAESAYRQDLICQPGFSKALTNLGNLLDAEGRLDEALDCYRESVANNPNSAASHNNLGTSLQKKGLVGQAQESYRRALVLHADFPSAHCNLGAALLAAGDASAALPHIDRALALRPNYANALMQKGRALLALGRPTDALAALQPATSLLPNAAEVYLHLGRALLALSQQDKAIAALSRATQLQPDHAAAHEALAAALLEKLDAAGAAGALDKALHLRPNDELRVKRATLLPALVASNGEINAWRDRIELGLNELLATPLAIPNPFAAETSASFYLAYHGRSDRVLHTKLAQVFAKGCPILRFTARHCDHDRNSARLRVGFISRFMHRHSVGRTTRGLIAELPRDRFEVVALFVSPLKEDDLSHFIGRRNTRRDARRRFLAEPSYLWDVSEDGVGSSYSFDCHGLCAKSACTREGRRSAAKSKC